MAMNEWKVAICLRIEKEIKSSICRNESNTRVGTAKHTLRQRSRTCWIDSEARSETSGWNRRVQGKEWLHAT